VTHPTASHVTAVQKVPGITTPELTDSITRGYRLRVNSVFNATRVDVKLVLLIQVPLHYETLGLFKLLFSPHLSNRDSTVSIYKVITRVVGLIKQDAR